MNAACAVAKTLSEVKVFSETSAGAVLVGSITLQAREGNPEPRWFVGDGYALNSYGMPNGGIEQYRKELPEMITVVHAAGKVFFLDIAGFSTDDYVQLATMAQEVGVDVLELNLGCPNIRTDGVQKPIVSFDRIAMQEIIDSVAGVFSGPLVLKLSPYSNPAELKAVAELINASGKIAAVTTMNTMPNGYMSTHGEPVVSMTFAGVSGKAVQPIALGQVKQFRDALDPKIAVIGVGGIESKEDVDLFLSAGASYVQAATLIVRDGPESLERLAK
jgi:dihydroorotate dehydrogenase